MEVLSATVQNKEEITRLLNLTHQRDMNEIGGSFRDNWKNCSIEDVFVCLDSTGTLVGFMDDRIELNIM